jgi:hypothetical protein
MSDEQIKAKREEKVKKIEALCAELKITLSAEQAIMGVGPNNLIRNVIFYTDNETYPVAPAPTVIREKETPASI